MDKDKIGMWVVYTAICCTLVLILQISIGNINFERIGISNLWNSIKGQLATIISFGAMIVAIFNVREVRKQRKKCMSLY